MMLGLTVTTTSCEDMLTPDLDRYAQDFSGRDTVNFYFGILSNLQDVVENNVLLGEMRGDLAETSMYVNDSVAEIVNYENTMEDGDNGLLNRAAYYKVINQCNFYLAKADTMAMKNNFYYMRREFAQVQMVRAWTYMQLVQLYGEVPFITKPVDNANTGWEKNPEAFASSDNILELLQKAGLDRAYQYEKLYGRPNYGTVNNGGTSIPTGLFVFPADVVLGDLYLLRGSSKADYEQAARYYYNYIEEMCERYMRLSIARGGSLTYDENRNQVRPVSAGSWETYLKSTSQYMENITILPSSTNARIGKMLTRVPQTYGFDVSSSSSNADEGSSESGSVSVEANYKNRQLEPSARYMQLAQNQRNFLNRGEVAEYGLGDTRFGGTVSKVHTNIGDLYFVNKGVSPYNVGYDAQTSTTNFNFCAVRPVYRLSQVYLRFAEAINRAGFPRYAYTILRKGFTYDKMPQLADSIVYDSTSLTRKNIYKVEYQTDGVRSIDINELRRAQDHLDFLDFSNSIWSGCGIHEFGTGVTEDIDTLSFYEVVVNQRIADEALRVGNTALAKKYYSKAKHFRATEEGGETEPGADPDDSNGDGIPNRENWELVESDKPSEPSLLEINAVETLIADEMALETAYEGYRFFDLTRIARHKNASDSGLDANYGTTWFAWQVARRSQNLKNYETPNVYNSTLFNKLLNTQNWYLPNPQY